MADIYDFNKCKSITADQLTEELTQELAKKITPEMMRVLLSICAVTGDLSATNIIAQGKAAEVLAGLVALNKQCIEWMRFCGFDWRVNATALLEKYALNKEDMDGLLDDFTTSSFIMQ